MRPALDADNFVVGDKPLPASMRPPVKAGPAKGEHRVGLPHFANSWPHFQSPSETDKRELNRLLAEGPFAMAYGISEGSPHNVRMQMRGEPDQPGVEVQRGLIRSLGGRPLPADTLGSGRLQLAQWLTRPDNPLTTHVMVNRIWQYHFGRGLVKTPNDFGVRRPGPDASGVARPSGEPVHTQSMVREDDASPGDARRYLSAVIPPLKKRRDLSNRQPTCTLRFLVVASASRKSAIRSSK